jgi:hypothetical protein
VRRKRSSGDSSFVVKCSNSARSLTHTPPLGTAHTLVSISRVSACDWYCSRRSRRILLGSHIVSAQQRRRPCPFPSTIHHSARVRPSALLQHPTYPFSSRRSLAIQPFTTVDLWYRVPSLLLALLFVHHHSRSLTGLLLYHLGIRRLEPHPHPEPAQFQTRNITSPTCIRSTGSLGTPLASPLDHEIVIKTGPNADLNFHRRLRPLPRHGHITADPRGRTENGHGSASTTYEIIQLPSQTNTAKDASLPWPLNDHRKLVGRRCIDDERLRPRS